MKKQTHNRRSASSCSSYSQHSLSMINLQPSDVQLQHKQKQKQNPKKTQFSQIQKQYLQVYSQIKMYCSSQSPKPEKPMLYKWKQCLKLAIQHCRDYHKNLLHTINTLKTNNIQLQYDKIAQIKSIKNYHDEQIKLLQNSWNKKILDLNTQYSRKQQQYKQTLSKFIQTLHQSQKNWAKISTEMTNKIKKTQEILKQKIDIQIKNKQICQDITNFTNQIISSQYNSNTNSNSNNYVNIVDDSFCSINLSNDQLALHIPKLQSRRNTIDISSIQQIHQVNDQQVNDGRFRFQDCLIQMIYWGFFSLSNQSNIKKLIEITKNIQNPQNIIKQPIFPIILQAIKLKLQLNFQYEESEEEFNDNSDIQCQGHQEDNRIVMRDIQNQRF